MNRHDFAPSPLNIMAWCMHAAVQIVPRGLTRTAYFVGRVSNAFAHPHPARAAAVAAVPLTTGRRGRRVRMHRPHHARGMGRRI